MKRLTNEKNATGEPTGRTAGSWHVEYRCATRKDTSEWGTSRLPTLRIERRLNRICDSSPDNFCARKTRSDGGSPGICTTLRAKTSSLWQQCLVKSGVQFLPAREDHVGSFPSVRRWRTSASVMSARFLTCCIHRRWIRLV